MPPKPRKRRERERREEDTSRDEKALMAWYRIYDTDLDKAQPDHVKKVIRSFQKKASKAGGGDWRKMMYGKFIDQNGRDPRKVLEEAEHGFYPCR